MQEQRILYANGISDGVAYAPLLFVAQKKGVKIDFQYTNPDIEWARFINARNTIIEELSAVVKKADDAGLDDASMILMTHQMILNDVEFEKGVAFCINSQEMDAVSAVKKTGDDIAKMIDALDVEYIKARSEDIRDVVGRIADEISGIRVNDLELTDNSIVVAETMSPAELLKLDRDKLSGIILSSGSANGHLAILARSMKIPVVSGISREKLRMYVGCKALLDGIKGYVEINPTKEKVNQIFRRKGISTNADDYERYSKIRQEMYEDGCGIEVCCNIGCLEEASFVVDNKADGIGLFRSEFLYLSGENFPTEDGQFEVYKKILETMDGKRVTIRTADLGSDKGVEYLKLPNEENPALGLRGIRYSLKEKDVFKTQLRALIKASAYGKLSIMFPMINSVEEFIEAKDVFNEAVCELEKEDFIFDKNIEIGVMIETPAAALMSKELSEVADFFSIGTNDLAQYTLACDRGSGLMEYYVDDNKAVLWLINLAACMAKDAGIRVSVCGELAANPEMTEFFINAGIDELSVNVDSVSKIRQKICKIWESNYDNTK